MILPVAGTEEAGAVDEVGVHAARALEGVEEHDEEDDAPGQHDLGEQAEAEGHRDERHQGDPRQRVEGHDERVASSPALALRRQEGLLAENTDRRQEEATAAARDVVVDEQHQPAAAQGARAADGSVKEGPREHRRREKDRRGSRHGDQQRKLGRALQGPIRRCDLSHAIRSVRAGNEKVAPPNQAGGNDPDPISLFDADSRTDYPRSLRHQNGERAEYEALALFGVENGAV